MPDIKAENLKTGHVLVDPDGHLYEVMGTFVAHQNVHVWLWRDSSAAPDFYQMFSVGEDVVGINAK